MSSVTDFIGRWQKSGGSEQANSQPFLGEFCDVLNLPRPEPATAVNEENVYAFERKIYSKQDGAERLLRLDLYRQGCFVLEAKQGQDKAGTVVSDQKVSTSTRRGSPQWENAMLRAKRQAEHYIRCLPAQEGRPPFLIVADIGYCFDLYTEFSRSGGLYQPYPEATHYRIMLQDLAKPEVQNLFRSIWNDPDSLDPAKRAAAVTSEVAAHLADLARLIEAEGFAPEKVSQFLMRCIFSMFAEDVGLLPANSFTDILERSLKDGELFQPLLRDLWQAMNEGKVSVTLGRKLLRFNGGIFADQEIIPLNKDQLKILLEAARADWHEVEPAIFGTLLERALDPSERHKLGAHYTPRSYVERIVMPTIIQPLRSEWEAVNAAASLLHNQYKDAETAKLIEDFYNKLLNLRILDPACGSGNFLYVSMEHLKRLEAEVLRVLTAYGGRRPLQQIDPHQFLGLELNPRAAGIAEMVLWIGYLQWHYRVHGNVAPPEPIIKKCRNIEHRDALLSYKKITPAKDANGNIITHWDGVTFKTDPRTGRQIPDDTSRVVEYVYEGVTETQWPEADFIVGNPPFLGGKDKRQGLGDGYFKALAKVYKEVPEAADFVMYWWYKAASLAKQDKIKRFGFISTNSITQVFNRRVLAHFLNGDNHLRLIYAIPDHPWVNAADGATVRIAMTVAGKANDNGTLDTVIKEQATSEREYFVEFESKTGKINSNLTIGADVTQARPLVANSGLSCPGMKLHGSGFIVTQEEAVKLGLGKVRGLEKHIRQYRNGKDLNLSSRNVMVIDLFGLTIDEVLKRFPDVYQWVLERVKPERDVNKRASYREKWWIFGEPRKEFRPALEGLSRYIATTETTKQRFFVFLDSDILPDNRLINIAISDAYYLGILSSSIHILWSKAAGGTLGIAPIYTKSVCFDPFPFPDPPAKLRQEIADLAETIDRHRKEHAGVTLTEMYNVLQALREGRELTPKEKEINAKALVSVLDELHKRLDAAVFKAYDWPETLTDEQILSRLVELNAERAKEEKNGRIRWLRPEYQASQSTRRETLTTKPIKKVATQEKIAWPQNLKDQFQAVWEIIQNLRAGGKAILAEEIDQMFVTRRHKKRIAEIMAILEQRGLI